MHRLIYTNKCKIHWYVLEYSDLPHYLQIKKIYGSLVDHVKENKYVKFWYN